MTTQNLPDVTILMPTYKAHRWLVDLLPILRQQCDTYPGHAEILVVDSGSNDGTVDVLKAYGATVVEIPHAHFSHGYARNLGVRHAKTDLILFMSADALPVGDDWLVKMVHLLDDPKIGAAHIRQLPRPNATPLEVFFNYEMYPGVDKRFTWKPTERMTLDKMFFSNVCSITYRDLALKYPFPENLIMSEDQIFAKLVLQAGYDTLYNSTVAVIHSHNYSLKALFRRNFDSAYSLLDISADTIGSSAVDGIRFITHEIAFLVKSGHWLWLAYVPIYEIARISGRIFGHFAMHLPLKTRVMFSYYSNYWTRSTVSS